jgi:hypothetical protein
MNFKPLLPSVLACALAGCAAPMVTPEGPSMQSKVAYVKDWDELAQRTANHFVSQCQCDKRVVFVAPGPSHMAFASAYRKLLEDKLLKNGVEVSENALPASVVLTFQVQAFLHDKDNMPLPVIWWPVAGAFDEIASIYQTTPAEVLLTVSVLDGTYLRYRDAREFYVHPADLALYTLPQDGAHWVNDNPAGAVRADWPQSWDTPSDHPALDALVGPERRMVMGGD